MAAFIDACRFNPTLGGSTDWTYSSAVPGYQSPALAGAVNGKLYKLRSESADLTQWEFSEGAYNSSTGVFARTTILSNSSGTGTSLGQSGAGTKINFTLVPQVAIVGMAEDVPSLTEINSFTNTTASTSTTTGAMTIAGGLGIGGALNAGGVINFSNTTAAAAYNSAALTVAGGIGVAGGLYIGTGSAGGSINLNGATGTNVGPFVTFRYNGASTFGFGRSAAVLGGATDDFVITAAERADGTASIDITRGTAGAGGVVSFMNGVGGNPAAGGSLSSRILFGGGNLGLYWGSGAPTVSAAQGSLYIRTDGSSTSTRMYVNTNGSTTWTNAVTAI